MARLLKPLPALLCLATLAAAAQAPLSDDRHDWTLDVDLGYAAASSDLGAWPDGALGKLRYDTDDEALEATRLSFDYRGRIRPTLVATIVADYVDDASSGIDLSEAFLQWRPVPSSALRQHWRFGAVYPRISLENGDRGWASPFTTSFSTVNAWLGEEIRPLAIEWNGERRLGSAGSPHELGAFSAAFYANDPAGTLLFWRGFSLHDRQTRLGDRLSIPPQPVFQEGAVVGLQPNSVKPFDEIDHRPGYYAGIQWQYATRARLQLSVWDNRADPAAFSDGQWAWRTRFRQLAGQFSLPGDIGLLAQWMRGATYWFIRTGPNGSLSALSSLVRDDFDARYVLVTKRIANRHRVTLRHDRFDMHRVDEIDIDSGHAWTLAYQFEIDSRMSVAAEYLEIRSHRDIWRDFYEVPPAAHEQQWRLTWRLRLGAQY